MTYMESVKLQEQCLGDSLAWHTGVNGIEDTAKIEAYKAGFQNGWGALVTALSLRGLIKLTEPEFERNLDSMTPDKWNNP